MTNPPQRRGRRPSHDPSARQSILEAARVTFGELGYAHTSLRTVAHAAGVDVSLLSYYFGSKEALFAEALELPARPADLIRMALETPAADLGRSMVRLILNAWAKPELTIPFQGIIESNVLHPAAWDEVNRFFTDQVIAPIAAALGGGEEAELRAALALSHLSGLMLLRFACGLAPLSRTSIDDLVDLVGPVIQGYLTGPLPAGGQPGGQPTTHTPPHTQTAKDPQN